MNTPITCPGCCATVEVPDELIGMRVRCPIPECGLTFTAEVQPTNGPAAPRPLPVEAPPPRIPTKPQYNIPPLPQRPFRLHIGWTAMSLLCLAIIVTALATLLNMLLTTPASLDSPPDPKAVYRGTPDNEVPKKSDSP